MKTEEISAMAEFPLGGRGPRERSPFNYFLSPRGVTQLEQRKTKLASRTGNQNIGEPELEFPSTVEAPVDPKESRAPSAGRW